MKFEEALKLMREGKKMTTRFYSGEESYFYFDDNENFEYHNKNAMLCGCAVAHLTMDFCNSDWYEYKPPILDEEEKAYLEAVLRPFKDKVEFIVHRKDCNFQLSEYIFVYINTYKQMEFPDFTAGSMYKGMELGKQYTLKELGLFEEDK